LDKGETIPFTKQKNRNICDLAEDILCEVVCCAEIILTKEICCDMIKAEKVIGMWKNK